MNGKENMSIADMKMIQRKAGIAAREAMEPELAASCSRAICEKLLAMAQYQAARTVFTYQPFHGEVDVSYFNARAAVDGKLVAYPICHGHGEMVAAVPAADTAWAIGKFGIRVPIEAQCEILKPSEIDIVIVPCTAFDSGTLLRVGMGGGYYDRYLPPCAGAVTVAAAFEAQRVNAAIAHSEYDVPLCAIATELAWYT